MASYRQLDRFALSLDVEAPPAAEDRATIVDARMRFDADPASFCKSFDEAQKALGQAIAAARARAVRHSPEILLGISQTVTNTGVTSLRASVAHAALRAAVAAHRLGAEAAGSSSRDEATPGAARRTAYFPWNLTRHPKSGLDVAGFTQSFRNTGRASLLSDRMVYRTSRVQSSVDTKDVVAVISFRSPKAEVVWEPCRDADAACLVLEFLPAGGRTLLAHALEAAPLEPSARVETLPAAMKCRPIRLDELSDKTLLKVLSA